MALAILVASLAPSAVADAKPTKASLNASCNAVAQFNKDLLSSKQGHLSEKTTKRDILAMDPVDSYGRPLSTMTSQFYGAMKTGNTKSGLSVLNRMLTTCSHLGWKH